jgi:hypothetical protein
VTDTISTPREQYEAALRDVQGQRNSVRDAILTVQRNRNLPTAQVDSVLSQLGLRRNDDPTVDAPNPDHLSDAGLRHHIETLNNSHAEFQAQVQRVIGDAQRTYPRHISAEDLRPVYAAAGLDTSNPASTGATRTITITANVSGGEGVSNSQIESQIRELAQRGGLTVHTLNVETRNIV